MDTELLGLKFETGAMDSELNALMNPEPTLDLQTDVKQRQNVISYGKIFERFGIDGSGTLVRSGKNKYEP
jgi:hypothetical protein